MNGRERSMYNLEAASSVRESLPPGRRSLMYSTISARPLDHSRRTSNFFINKSFNSLDYTAITNQIEIERQKWRTFRVIWAHSFLRVVLFLLTGILTAFMGVSLTIAIDLFSYFTYHKFDEFSISDFKGTFEDFKTFIVYRFLGVIVPILIGTSLVTFIAPYAAGGGVAQAIGYLNGIRVPHVLSLKGLVVKALSTICSCISGLAAGKEGPMIHIGTIIGGRLPSALPWLEFKLDNERRDFAAAGFGAGIAVVFGAPIGGLLLALEEGVSFLELGLMWKIYLCCIISYATGIVVSSLIYGEEVKLNSYDHLELGTISSDVTDYQLFEMPLFALVGVFGGLIAVLLIRIHIEVVLFRDRYITTKIRKIIAASIVGCFVVIFQGLSIWYFRTCSDIPTAKERTRYHFAPILFNNFTTHLHQLYCPEGKRSDMALLFSKTQGDLLILFFGKSFINMSSLCLFGIIYFILLCLTMGISISGGIFIPQIILGATWGRAFGTFLNQLVDDGQWAKPAKYAFLGAATQLSGTVGKTFSILVIFVEASGSISFSVPLMMIVSITRMVCSFFALPVYETQMHLMGLPFLPHRPPPLPCDVPITRHMSQTPLVTLPPSPTVSKIIATLTDDAHNGYPIVETGKEGSRPVLVGLILRQQLLILLKYNAYKYPTPSTPQQLMDCFKTYIKESSKNLDVQKIISEVEEEFYNVKLNLAPYYNNNPMTVNEDLPLIQAYELFRNLGIRHLVVITKSYEPIGIVTRIDLAKFHTIETFCNVKVKEMYVH